jgi:hypothetical protein
MSRMSRVVPAIPEVLKAALERVAAETERSEAKSICEGIRLPIARIFTPGATHRFLRQW